MAFKGGKRRLAFNKTKCFLLSVNQFQFSPEKINLLIVLICFFLYKYIINNTRYLIILANPMPEQFYTKFSNRTLYIIQPDLIRVISIILFNSKRLAISQNFNFFSIIQYVSYLNITCNAIKQS